jgi:uncharacterized protein YecE (DUF72 family)
LSEIRIGTSGWHYASWSGKFYPPDVPKKRLLQYYTAHFDTAELNAPFYRTPTLKAVKAWRDDTPGGFCFAWKASRFITHWKRLSPKSKSSLRLMEGRIRRLDGKAGPILFQLPARFKMDAKRLSDFLKLVPKGRRYAFEFRDESWYCEEVYRVLRKNGVAFCISDHADAPAPWKVTARLVYVRGHGPTGRYKGSYSDATLKSWARRIRNWRKEGRHVFCYFDNDQKSVAPFDAKRLMKLLKIEPCTQAGSAKSVKTRSSR